MLDIGNSIVPSIGKIYVSYTSTYTIISFTILVEMSVRT